MSNESKALILALTTTLIVCLCCACGYDVIKEIL